MIYTVYDENQRQFRPNIVQLTQLGSDNDDVIMYKEYDSRFSVKLNWTYDEEFVIVNSRCDTETSSEVYALNASKPLDGLRLIHKRVPGVSCLLEHQIVVPPGEDVSLADMYDCHERMLLDSKKSGSLEVSSSDDEDVGVSSSDDKDVDVSLSDDKDSDSTSDDEDSDSSSDEEDSDSSSDDEDSDSSSDDEDSEEGKLMDLHGGYALERKEVISHDGVRVPLKIVYSRKMYEKGKSPGLLHGYGAYGSNCSVEAGSNRRLSLLDAGWVLAFADVRGGRSADPCWHEKGRKLNKINSIKDFVSCGEYLINEGYVNEYRLAAKGASAGGLLVGAAINMSPQLFRAAILAVPFVDACNSILDPSLPLRMSDYKEFGNPELKSEFESILSYSLYDNIREGVRYPSMLVTSYFHDVRVPVWEGAKWVAKIRESTPTNCSSVILKTGMIGGHLGERGDFSYYFGYHREKAFEHAFFMKVMGMHHNAENDIRLALEE